MFSTKMQDECCIDCNFQSHSDIFEEYVVFILNRIAYLSCEITLVLSVITEWVTFLMLSMMLGAFCATFVSGFMIIIFVSIKRFGLWIHSFVCLDNDAIIEDGYIRHDDPVTKC